MDDRRSPQPGREHTKNKAARLISDLANPLFLPTLVFGITGWSIHASIFSYAMFTGIAFIFYTAIPLGIVQWLLSQKHISSLDVPEHETRHRLFRYVIISSCTGSMILWFIGNHSLLQAFALIYFLNPIVGLLINFRWKASIHAASVGITGCLISYFYIIEVAKISFFDEIVLILTLLLILLSMMWARYRLRIHSVSEIITGAALGTGLTILELILFL